MTRFVPMASLVALLLSPAPPSRAAIPSPGNSTIPLHAALVGRSAAVPDSAAGHFIVTVRDLANNPVAGDQVTLDFSGCADLRIAADPLDPRLQVSCAHHTVAAITGTDGVASFTLVGASFARAATPGPQWMKVYALGGTLLGSVPLAAYDLNGDGGVTLADLALFSADYFGGTLPGRSDYKGDGIVTLTDLGLWARTYFAAGSTASAASYCP